MASSGINPADTDNSLVPPPTRKAPVRSALRQAEARGKEAKAKEAQAPEVEEVTIISETTAPTSKPTPTLTPPSAPKAEAPPVTPVVAAQPAPPVVAAQSAAPTAEAVAAMLANISYWTIIVVAWHELWRRIREFFIGFRKMLVCFFIGVTAGIVGPRMWYRLISTDPVMKGSVAGASASEVPGTMLTYSIVWNATPDGRPSGDPIGLIVPTGSQLRDGTPDYRFYTIPPKWLSRFANAQPGASVPIPDDLASWTQASGDPASLRVFYEFLGPDGSGRRVTKDGVTHVSTRVVSPPTRTGER